MTAEEWRPVVGYEGVYEVSNVGRVRRIGKAHGARVGMVLKTRLNWGGYPSVRLRVDDKSFNASVHVLVCQAFVGPSPGGGYEVNHIDSDRTNPVATNLEWVTRSGNITHARAAGRVNDRRGEQKPGHKLTWAAVREIRSSTESAVALGRKYGVHNSTISDIRRGEKWREESTPLVDAAVEGLP